MLLLLEINFLHLILPVALLLAGWPPPLPRTHPFHRGEGGWCYDHDHGRGGGGGTRNLEHIYIYICFQEFPGVSMSFTTSFVLVRGTRVVKKDAMWTEEHAILWRRKQAMRSLPRCPCHTIVVHGSTCMSKFTATNTIKYHLRRMQGFHRSHRLFSCIE